MPKRAVKCGRCGQLLRVDPTAGPRFKCPKCGATLVVRPKPDEVVDAVPMAEADEPAAPPCPKKRKGVRLVVCLAIISFCLGGQVWVFHRINEGLPVFGCGGYADRRKVRDVQLDLLLKEAKRAADKQDWTNVELLLARLEPYQSRAAYAVRVEDIRKIKDAMAAARAAEDDVGAKAVARGLSPGLVVAYYSDAKRTQFHGAAICQMLNWASGGKPPQVEGLPKKTAIHVVGWLWVDQDGTHVVRCSSGFGTRMFVDGELAVPERRDDEYPPP